MPEPLVLDALRNIEESLLHIIDRTSMIKTADDFGATPTPRDCAAPHPRLFFPCLRVGLCVRQRHTQNLLQYPLFLRTIPLSHPRRTET